MILTLKPLLFHGDFIYTHNWKLQRRRAGSSNSLILRVQRVLPRPSFSRLSAGFMLSLHYELSAVTQTNNGGGVVGGWERDKGANTFTQSICGFYDVNTPNMATSSYQYDVTEDRVDYRISYHELLRVSWPLAVAVPVFRFLTSPSPEGQLKFLSSSWAKRRNCVFPLKPSTSFCQYLICFHTHNLMQFLGN